MRLIALASSIVLAFAATAMAQPIHPQTPFQPILLARVDGQSTVNVTASHDVVTTAPDAPIASVAALTAFRLNFENGDHKLRRLSVTAQRGLAQLALADVGVAQPFAAHAVWTNFANGGQAGSVTQVAGGTAQLPIPAGPANSTFVLTGFQFTRRGLDANIRAVSINLSPGGQSIAVSLTDDQRIDLRHAPTVQGCAGCNGARPYTVTVQYAWIPNALVAASGSITGNEFGRDAASIPNGAAVIRGFSFNFLNSDHFLAHIEVNTANGGVARYQDVNAGDPMRWQVDYAMLR